MAFRIGQKVVCVDDADRGGEILRSKKLGLTFRLRGGLDGLKRGQIYTVRGIDVDWADDDPVLFLEEIVRPPFEHYGETGFLQSRFRPVVERKQSTETGMSILRGLLNPTKVDESIGTTTSRDNRAVHQYSSIEQGAR